MVLTGNKPKTQPTTQDYKINGGHFIVSFIYEGFFLCLNIQEKKVNYQELMFFTPDPYTDYRGTMWTHWENSMDTPQSKISKFTRSRKNVLRGLQWRY